jgi:hypothetical protein
VLSHQRAQEAPVRWCVSLCAARGATQCLRCADDYSPSTNTTMIPANILFTEAEAELESHVLWVCPLQWQDQYNLHEKGMMLLNMCLLIPFLRLLSTYVPRKRPTAHNPRKLPPRTRMARSDLAPNLRPELPRKVHQEALQPLQEAWGCAHYAQYERLSQI